LLPYNINPDIDPLFFDCSNSGTDEQKFAWDCEFKTDAAEVEIKCSATESKQSPSCSTHQGCLLTGYCENGKCKGRSREAASMLSMKQTKQTGVSAFNPNNRIPLAHASRGRTTGFAGANMNEVRKRPMLLL
jgi:hypothetical protein